MEDDAEREERYTFGRNEHLRERRDIDRAFKKGTRFSVKGLRLHVIPNERATVRALFIPVRGYGGAVKRNRARRLVSEAFRLAKPRLTQGRDFVFVLYPGTNSFKERAGQVERVLHLAGVMPGGACERSYRRS